MYASRDIKKDETIMFIPDHLIFTIEKGIDTELGQLMKKNNLLPGKFRLIKPNMHILSIQNLQELAKGSDSKFFLHFQSIPDTAKDFPV